MTACRYCGHDHTTDRPLERIARPYPEPPVWRCVDGEACVRDQERAER
jgi:hypothetical protein